MERLLVKLRQVRLLGALASIGMFGGVALNALGARYDNFWWLWAGVLMIGWGAAIVSNMMCREAQIGREIRRIEEEAADDFASKQLEWMNEDTREET